MIGLFLAGGMTGIFLAVFILMTGKMIWDHAVEGAWFFWTVGWSIMFSLVWLIDSGAFRVVGLP